MNRSLVLALWLAFLVSTGCAGQYPDGPSRARGPTQAGVSAPADLAEAGMRYRVLRARGGGEISAEAFYQELAAADAICVGEQHTDPHDHWAQREILDQLSARRSGRPLALGMEMFQRSFQGVLDDFAGRRIDADALHSRSGWEERWGHDFAMYAPILELAVARGLVLVALNIESELRHKISRQGMDALTRAERARVPEYDLRDEEHRAWFDEAMRAAGDAHGQHSMPAGHGRESGAGELPPGHPPIPGQAGAAGASPLYLAQVLWDETMAETAVAWLAAGAGRQMVIIAGNGHCHESAIERRIKRRGVANVLSVRPILDDGDGDIAAELAAPVVDYLFVIYRGAASGRAGAQPGVR